jgi:hypothetical protein
MGIGGLDNDKIVCPRVFIRADDFLFGRCTLHTFSLSRLVALPQLPPSPSGQSKGYHCLQVFAFGAALAVPQVLQAAKAQVEPSGHYSPRK